MILEKINQDDFVPSSTTQIKDPNDLKEELKKLNEEISNIIREKRIEEEKIIKMAKVQENEDLASKFLA